MSDDRRSLNSIDDIEFAVRRIEELEAKLAKAVRALENIAPNTCCDRCQDEAALWANATLAELSKERSDEKGQDDG